jgi:pyruvate,orthophosphate dikinase
MIEVPRGALTADEIASEAEFFSFGTNDLTQLTYGFSRDDIGKFLGAYRTGGSSERIRSRRSTRRRRPACRDGHDERPRAPGPAQGRRLRRARRRPVVHHFFDKTELDYVSCSPYRVPVARLAAAQAALQQKALD